MKFDRANEFLETMNQDDAIVFINFLRSEITRHEIAIDNARKLMYDICITFKLGDMLDAS